MILYNYWRSSASWRVRIALGLKGIPYEYVSVDLLGGAQMGEAHRARNPLAQVPVLELPDGTRLTQSLAIADWLDHHTPDPPLFPREPIARARAFAFAEVVNAGIQPLQNLSTLAAVEQLGGDKIAWCRSFVERGLLALEAAAKPVAGRFLVGDQPSIADICLVPQLYNLRRFGGDVEGLSTLLAVEARCNELPAFQAAHPDRQPDAPR